MQLLARLSLSVALTTVAFSQQPKVTGSAPQPAGLELYDLVWTTPSADASGSMPIGNGAVGCNVWVEQGGKLCFYVSRTDSFSEASRLLKLGKVVVQVRPPQPGEPFEQRLCLREGCIRVTWGAGESRLQLRLFVDSESDVVHVVGESARPGQVSIQASTWRTTTRRLEGEELRSSWTMQEAPDGIVVSESADRSLELVASAEGGQPQDVRSPRLGFFHRNATSIVPLTLRHQGLSEVETTVRDPLLHRMFGLVLGGVDKARGEIRDLREPVLLSAPSTTFAFHVAAPCVQDEDEAVFGRRAAELLSAADSGRAAARTAAWWRDFWARSWILVAGDPSSSLSVPSNDHPLRIGVDSDGGNRFVGRIEALALFPLGKLGLPADRLAAADPRELGLAPALELNPLDDLPLVLAERGDLALDDGFVITATLQQDPAHPVARIVDQLTAGGRDGFLLDTYPGHSLRLIVGDEVLLAPDVLTPGEVHRVQAICAVSSGQLALICDGKVVAQSTPREPAPPSHLTQVLTLQRWVQACGGRGAYPIKFNGSIFTVDPALSGGPAFDADWRRWGDCFWWQNTRLPYHPMLAQGDLEMLEPLFELYLGTLPLARERARLWHGVEGAWFPETMTLFGAYANNDYGWDRNGHQPNEVLCPWWCYAWNQGPELLALALDRYDYAPDAAFLRERVLPLAEAVLAYFDSRFPRDEQGRLRITPTQSLETYWHDVVNDMPTVAGLHDVLERLLALPEESLSARQHERWQRLYSSLPAVPLREVDGERVLAPAERFSPQRSNVENPELYAIWPFRRYGLGRPDLGVGRATYARRNERMTQGWTQDGQQAALLGLLSQARDNLLAKLRNSHPAHRFPAMWGPNFDWLPDQDHGSNILITAQAMLLQPVAGKLLVLPCWPAEWAVSFRLHAPGRTLVELEYRGGRLERLDVTPPTRRADILLPPELASEARRLGLDTFAR